MAPSTILLPRLRLSSRRESFEVTVQGSLLLDLPPSVLNGDDEATTTATHLSKAVRDDQLWINRLGPCILRFKVSSGVEGLVLGSVASVRACIRACEAWDRLGLRLVDMDSEAGTEEVAFSVQHPDLSSSLLPPRGALTSELREVKVSIHISSETVRGRGCQKPATVARIQQYDATGDEAPPASHELDAEDIQAIEDFLSSSQLLNDCGNARDPSSSTTLGMSQQSSTRSGSNASEDSLRALIVSALEIFLFGNKKRHAGFKWIEGGDWDGLVCIAPAVFHMPYLQGVAQKAKLMPTIATSLARMVDAESPSLRRLARSFELLHVRDEDDGPQSMVRTDAVSGIEKSVWKTLLANTTVPKPTATTQAKRKRTESGSIEQQATPPASQSDGISSPMEIFSPDMMLLEDCERGQILEIEDGVDGPWEELSPTLDLSSEALGVKGEELVEDDTMFEKDQTIMMLDDGFAQVCTDELVESGALTTFGHEGWHVDFGVLESVEDGGHILEDERKTLHISSAFQMNCES